MDSIVICSTETHSEEETRNLGATISRRLEQGDVVACYGDLGAGKTSFIKGICTGLGVKEHVSSPTFTIVNEYRGTTFPVYHFDFYRLKGVGELREIGFEEYLLKADGVCVIEWAEKVRHLLPRVRRYDVELAAGRDETTRTLVIRKSAEVVV